MAGSALLAGLLKKQTNKKTHLTRKRRKACRKILQCWSKGEGRGKARVRGRAEGTWPGPAHLTLPLHFLPLPKTAGIPMCFSLLASKFISFYLFIFLQQAHQKYRACTKSLFPRKMHNRSFGRSLLTKQQNACERHLTLNLSSMGQRRSRCWEFLKGHHQGSSSLGLVMSDRTGH